MATNSRTWKKAEGRVAALFGASRQPLSGSSGRDDTTRSDTTHPRLFVEAKYRERHAVRTLFDAINNLARKEGKTPVLALIDKGRPGFLLWIHSDDLSNVVAEFRAANIGPTGEGASRAEVRRPDEPASSTDALDGRGGVADRPARAVELAHRLLEGWAV
jgi:hypothetical protein